MATGDHETNEPGAGPASRLDNSSRSHNIIPITGKSRNARDILPWAHGPAARWRDWGDWGLDGDMLVPPWDRDGEATPRRVS